MAANQQRREMKCEKKHEKRELIRPQVNPRYQINNLKTTILL